MSAGKGTELPVHQTGNQARISVGLPVDRYVVEVFATMLRVTPPTASFSPSSDYNPLTAPINACSSSSVLKRCVLARTYERAPGM